MKKLITLTALSFAFTSCISPKLFQPGSPVMGGYSKNDSVMIVFIKGNAKHFADRKARAERKARANLANKNTANNDTAKTATLRRSLVY